MAYNYNTFLKPLNIGDKNLLIFNDAEELVYTINPFSVLNTQVRGNIITISVKSGRTILLDFLNSNYAIEALPILQNRIKTLTDEVPNFIDKQVENWVLDLIVGTAIPVGSSSSGSKGEIRVNNGEYLYIHTGAQWLKSSMTFSTF